LPHELVEAKIGKGTKSTGGVRGGGKKEKKQSNGCYLTKKSHLVVARQVFGKNAHWPGKTCVKGSNVGKCARQGKKINRRRLGGGGVKV